MSRSAVIGLALCMLPILSVAAAPTPSFDCLRAQSPVEKTICQQAELAELDRQLNSAYWQFIKQLPNAQQETARQMQRNWIRAREQDCRQNEPVLIGLRRNPPHRTKKITVPMVKADYLSA